MKKSTKIFLIVGIILAIILCIVGIYLSKKNQTNYPVYSYYIGDPGYERYNNVVTDYIKDNSDIPGSDVKSMIAGIQEQNTEYVDESGKFISIEVKGYEGEGEKRNNLGDDVYKIANYTRGEELRDKCKAANWWDGGENTRKNVEEATIEMNELRRRIKAENKYKVTVDTDEDVIIRIHIGLVEETK